MKYVFQMLQGIALVPLLATGAWAAEEWLTDLPTAQARARASSKSVFLHFSGSDWCGWCIELKKEVFLRPEFDAYARSNLVLVRVDFPKRKQQPVTLQKANQKLADQFGVQGYPTMILLSSQGEKLGNVSYGHGGARQFLKDVEKVIHPPTDLPAKLPSGKHAASSPPGTSKVKATSITELTLSKITGKPRQRQAIINNRSLATGETATLRLASGKVRVRCVEIRERSVVVMIEGEATRRELTLPSGA